MIRRLDFEKAHSLLQETPSLILLDVREEPEYLSGHAIDALLLPVDEISSQTASELIPSLKTPIMVYCRTGRRSARAAKILEKLGYTCIYDLGGLVGWPYGME